MGFSGGSDGKESTCKPRRPGFNPWVRKIPWRRKWQPTQIFLPGKPHEKSSHDLVTKQQQGVNIQYINISYTQ